MQDKKAGGIYAIEDDALKVEAIESMSTFTHIGSLDDFLKSVHRYGNDGSDRYYVCVAPAAWEHCVENRSGASSPVDAAKEMIDLLSEGYPIYVWDSLAKLAYRFDPTPYIFEAFESKKVGPEPLTESSSSEKVSQAAGVDDASAELSRCIDASHALEQACSMAKRIQEDLGEVRGEMGKLRGLLELRDDLAEIIEYDTDSEAYMISRICKRLGIDPPTFAPRVGEDMSSDGFPAAPDEESDDYELVPDSAYVTSKKERGERHAAEEVLAEQRELAAGGRGKLAAIETREREATGITSLKVKYNSVFGYFLEVPRAHASKVPKGWVRKQTLVNAERYVTEELAGLEAKVLDAQSR